MWILQPPCVCQRHAVFFVSFLCLLGPCTRNFVDIGQELFVWEPTKGTASKHHFHLLYSVQLCLHLDAVLCNCSQMESSCLNWTKFRELQAKTHTDIEKKNHRLLWHPGDFMAFSLWRVPFSSAPAGPGNSQYLWAPTGTRLTAHAISPTNISSSRAQHPS